MHVSQETPAQTHHRLLGVLARAEFEVIEGTFPHTDYPCSVFPAEAIAFVRDEDVWSVLAPAVAGAPEPLRLFAFHFPTDADNSGFVGWLASHLKATTGTGVLVVCGHNGTRGGIFDYGGSQWPWRTPPSAR